MKIPKSDLKTPDFDALSLLSLSFFSKSNYLCVIYDKAGTPSYIFNKQFYLYRAFAELLEIRPIFYNYNVPAIKDLNILFDGQEAGPAITLIQIPEIEERIRNSFGKNYARRFRSKNILEGKSELSKITAAYPLTDISLIRLSGEQFLGIISVNEIFHRIAAFEENLVLIADTRERIAGYTDVLCDLLGLEEKRELLGRPLTEVVRFVESRRKKDEASQSQPPYKLLYDWKGTRPIGEAFRLIQKAPSASLTKTEDGLLWDNTEANGYSYLQYKEPLDVDTQSIRLLVDFSGPEGDIPNLIIRGRKIDLVSTAALETMDFYGYNLSSAGYSADKNSHYLLKKGGTAVFSAQIGERASGTIVRMEFRKEGGRFVLRVDDTPIMDWSDYSPFRRGSDHVFTFFLRPGKRILLKTIRLETAPESDQQPMKRWPRRSAEIRYGKDKFLFNVNQTPQFWDGRTLSLFLLDDVSDFRDSIDSLRTEKDRLESILKQEHSLTGRTPSIIEIRKTIEVIAGSNLAVLIEGETGTGKEVLARAIHQAGPRRNQPFVRIDCAMFPETLMEAELFGYEKGAFTGAVAAHAGRFEQAQGGVVFLDEVANLPLGVQAKLLGVLQDFRIQRVGGSKSVQLDIRLIAATNVPLRKMMAQGIFREDLYYRLNQMRFTLPPLRERREDIPLLAAQFIEEANTLYGKRVEGLSDEALAKIFNADWPGNVRELRAVMLRAVLFCEGRRILPAQITVEEGREPGAGVQKGTKTAVRKKHKRLAITKDELEKLVEKEKGNLARISKALDISRPSAYKFIHLHGIDLANHRARGG